MTRRRGRPRQALALRYALYRSRGEPALENFARSPGTRLYQSTVDRFDTCRVVLAEKVR